MVAMNAESMMQMHKSSRFKLRERESAQDQYSERKGTILKNCVNNFVCQRVRNHLQEQRECDLEAYDNILSSLFIFVLCLIPMMKLQ